MSRVEPFVTFKDTDGQGKLQYYVMQRQYPNFVGTIVERPIEDSLACIPVAGHNLWVAFAGTVQGAYIPISKNMLREITETFIKMAEWYSIHRVMANPGRYKKFKV